LVVSLANTQQPLSVGLLGANRPSHEGVIDYDDRAIRLCRQAGFTEVRLPGDTDFSLTSELDRWDDDGVRFVFGYDAKANLIQRADDTDEEMYHELVTRAEAQLATTAQARARPRNVKDEIVRGRGYKTLRQTAQDVVEFSYRPGKCTRDYRVIALRKTISVERGENVLFSEYRYFFSAPRGALTYPLRSRERSEVISLGPMAYPASKGTGDNSMPSKPALVPRRMGRGDGGPAVILAKAGLPEVQSPDGAR
jgi:hypothetical protein